MALWDSEDMVFWGAFKIFSRWISDRGSIDFKFLGQGHSFRHSFQTSSLKALRNGGRS